MILKDLLFSFISVDMTTIYGVRPPELRFFQKQCDYYKWFTPLPIKLKSKETLDSYLNDHLHPSYMKTFWIDGLKNHVFVRANEVKKVLMHDENMPLCQFGCEIIEENYNVKKYLENVQ